MELVIEAQVVQKAQWPRVEYGMESIAHPGFSRGGTPTPRSVNGNREITSMNVLAQNNWT